MNQRLNYKCAFSSSSLCLLIKRLCAFPSMPLCVLFLTVFITSLTSEQQKQKNKRISNLKHSGAFFFFFSFKHLNDTLQMCLKVLN